MIITEISLLSHPKLAKRLVPRVKYNGPLLQLTEAESKEVAALKRQAIDLNTTICVLFRNLRFACSKLERQGMNEEICEKSKTVKNIENEIRRIKVNRHKAQKAEIEV